MTHPGNAATAKLGHFGTDTPPVRALRPGIHVKVPHEGGTPPTHGGAGRPWEAAHAALEFSRKSEYIQQ